MFIPEFLLELARDSPGNKIWVESLPSVIREMETKWHLQIGEPFTQNVSCSYVAPCVVEGKNRAVLKIGLPHEEALHEIEGLKLLQGQPTVKLLNFDKSQNAMLLEQCFPGTSLKAEQEYDQDEIICSLLPQIWKANYRAENFRPLSQLVTLWNKETYAKLATFPNPDLAKEGCRLKEKLIESTSEFALLATDLHAGNVLKAQREDWLVIDIKPYVGDPTYDLTQHLLNCTERLTDKPEAIIRRLAKLTGLSYPRLKDWLFARLATEFQGDYQNLAAKLR